jgi:hypothetical protein
VDYYFYVSDNAALAACGGITAAFASACDYK